MPERASRRCHRPRRADQARALEREGPELHRAPRAVRQGGGERRGPHRRDRGAHHRARRHRLRHHRGGRAQHEPQAVSGRHHRRHGSTWRRCPARWPSSARRSARASTRPASSGDADTADLLTGISREVDKYLWFLEAHLQAKRLDFERSTSRRTGRGTRSIWNLQRRVAPGGPVGASMRSWLRSISPACGTCTSRTEQLSTCSTSLPRGACASCCSAARQLDGEITFQRRRARAAPLIDDTLARSPYRAPARER